MKGADISELRDKYQGLGAYIIGAGPSLKHLNKFHFSNPPWPVLCVNVAAARVALLKLDNDVFLVQQDGGPRDKNVKGGVTPIVSVKQEYLFLKHNHRVTYDARQWGLNPSHLSAEIAVRVAKDMGCVMLELLCFDATVTGDGPEEYKTYGDKIRKQIDGTPACWILPN